jgi:acetoacetyl-CoA synthetase
MSSLAQRSPFRQIKAGNAKPPIFIAHGLGGTVQVAELAKNIGTRHPIFAIEAKGIDGTEEPLDRMEDMADFYLSALDRIAFDAGRPRGCILIGYSFGGLVALEMAQRLFASGHPVALLILLDAFPHPRFMAFSQRAPLFAKRMMLHARQIRRLPLSNAMAYLTKGLKRRLHLSETRSGALHLPDTPTASLPAKQATLQHVRESLFAAYNNYQPKFYPGKINFITTEEKTFFPDDPAKIWGRLSAVLEVETIPGHHLNIVTTEFGALASVLTRHIQEATSEDAEIM